VQGKNDKAAQRLLQDARAVEQAGAGMLLLEAIPAMLGAEITANSGIPHRHRRGCRVLGQVLVLHDMLDIYPGKKARFVKNYLHGASSIADAVSRYVAEVKAGVFPAAEHSF